MPVKDQADTGRDEARSDGEVRLNAWIDPKLRNDFKGVCSRRGVSMKDALAELMRSQVEAAAAG